MGEARRIVLSGASGLIGSALAERLAADGFEVVRLVRRDPKAGEVRWDPERGDLDPATLSGAFSVVHLSGENVGGGRWSREMKRRILESRTKSTTLIAQAAADAAEPPRSLVSASAVGYYGDGGDAVLDETSPRGDGFLAEVCAAWESSADAARQAGIRTVHLRVGVVLSGHGGALAKMLPPFKLGLGGKVGSGKQWMSWISLRDVVRVFARATTDASMSGAVNAVAPKPVTNADFTRALGKVLGRPTIVPVPALALRAAFGEMADATVLASQRATPRRLLELGFDFQDPDIESALAAALQDAA
jgi:uncharacterized protein (TIGR01777 family)